MFGLETVLFSLFLPSKNHNLHAGITSRMMRCNACMSLRFGSGWLVIYFWICSCTFILNIRFRVAYFLFKSRCTEVRRTEHHKRSLRKADGGVLQGASRQAPATTSRRQRGARLF